MRGGTPIEMHARLCRAGLSPRARGNCGERRRVCEGRRSIPACAGEPREQGISVGEGGVYPRVRGGTTPHRLRWGVT